MSDLEEILLDGEAGFKCYKSVSGETLRLGNLSRINLFVGENNSGKSRFLRELAQVKKLRFLKLSSQEPLARIFHTTILKTVPGFCK